jgi:hypothetical protein
VSESPLAALRHRVSTRTQTMIALGATLAGSAVIVFSQPIGSPWWTYADADGIYVAASLNLLKGRHTNYLDHPGIPIQEVYAATFAGEALALRAAHGTSRSAYVDDRLLHPDKTRWVFRGWSILFYLGGAALAFFVLLRLLGHWTWGLAGGLLWIGAPDATIDSIQARPDVLLTGLCLLAGYLITRASQSRAVGKFLLAVVVLGLTLTVKIHAFGLVPALAIGALVGHPPSGWRSQLIRDARLTLKRRRRLIGAILVLAVALAVISNWSRIPFTIERRQAAFFVLGVVLILAYLAAAIAVERSASNPLIRRIFDPFYGLLAVGIAVGLAAPLVFVLNDAFRALAAMRDTLLGRGVNSGVKAFHLQAHQFLDTPLRQASVVFALALVAALVGARRRDALPALWFTGSLVMGVMAAARLSTLRYYAPAFVLAIPAALWLFRRRERAAAPILVWALVAFVVIPQFQHRDGPAKDARYFERIDAQMERAADALVKPGEVMLTADYAPVGEERLGEVASIADYMPPYRSRFLSDQQVPFALAHGLRPRYYAGPAAIFLTKPSTINLAAGSYYVRPIRRFSTDQFGVVELLRGPGVASR